MSPARPRQRRFKSLRPQLLLIVVALATTLFLTSGDRLWRADYWLYDQVLRMTPGQNVSDPRILIVAVDEYSLETLGHWPWSRAVHAAAIRRLGAAGIKGLAIDLMFAERHGLDPHGDAALAAAMAEYGNVVLPVTVAHERQNGPMMELLPLPDLVASAVALGHTDIARDRDGLTRGVFLRAGLGGARWPALALALLDGAQHGTGMMLPGLQRPRSEHASPDQWARDRYVLLPPGQLDVTFTQVSFADLLSGNVPLPLLQDRWVMLGMTASGYGGTVATPAKQARIDLPGVEFHAYILRTLLDGTAITPLSRGWQTVLACLFVLLSFGLYVLNPLRNGPAAIGLAIALLLATSAVLLFGTGRWFAPAAPLAVLSACLPLLLSIHLRRFRHMASHDPMTGLANRRSLAEIFEREWRGAIRSGRPIALLLIDVDAFKPYNDRYGHRRGDGALRTVAQAIARTARRPRDLAARSGGEEFAVLLPETGLEAAREIAEDLRGRIFDLGIHHDDSAHAQKLTVSIGVHACFPAVGENLDALYDAADRALYRAKHQGRNRVCL